jgi:hypothetical protein
VVSRRALLLAAHHRASHIIGSPYTACVGGAAMFIFKRPIIGSLAGLAVSVLVVILDALLRAGTL